MGIPITITISVDDYDKNNVIYVITLSSNIVIKIYDNNNNIIIIDNNNETFGTNELIFHDYRIGNNSNKYIIFMSQHIKIDFKKSTENDSLPGAYQFSIGNGSEYPQTLTMVFENDVVLHTTYTNHRHIYRYFNVDNAIIINNTCMKYSNDNIILSYMANRSCNDNNLFLAGIRAEDFNYTDVEFAEDSIIDVTCKKLGIKTNSTQIVDITNTNPLTISDVLAATSVTTSSTDSDYKVHFSGVNTLSDVKFTEYKTIGDNPTETDKYSLLENVTFYNKSSMKHVSVVDLYLNMTDDYYSKTFNLGDTIPYITEYRTTDNYSYTLTTMKIPSDFNFKTALNDYALSLSGYSNTHKSSYKLLSPPEFIMRNIKSQKFNKNIITFLGPPFKLNIPNTPIFTSGNATTTYKFQNQRNVYGCHAKINIEGAIYTGIVIDKYFIILNPKTTDTNYIDQYIKAINPVTSTIPKLKNTETDTFWV